MLVATKTFTLNGKDVQRGQRVGNLDPRLEARLITSRHVMNVDEKQPARLVVTRLEGFTYDGKPYRLGDEFPEVPYAKRRSLLGAGFVREVPVENTPRPKRKRKTAKRKRTKAA